MVTRFPDDTTKPYEKIEAAIMSDGKKIEFDLHGGRYNSEKKTVVGRTKEGEPVEIPMTEIMYVQVKKFDVVGTVLLTLSIFTLAAIATLVLIAMLKESCPFVYSYDGEEYVFDAEPLGGAICPGMARSELSRLDYLKEVDGKYRLIVRNEVDETQYLDMTGLLVYDHSPDIELIADSSGNVYGIAESINPLSAVDENGNNLLQFFEESDNIHWQSRMPDGKTSEDESIRHEITCRFLKPPDAKRAVLLVNAGATLWGSRMIKEMLILRGDKVDDWYQGIADNSFESGFMKSFMMQEELYLLRINVKNGDVWTDCGYIHSGGPFMIEDRALQIDISDIPGDTLTLRFNPPFGFWKIDYLAVAYDDYSAPEPVELKLSSARDLAGNDVTSLLRETDKEYCIMPEIGDQVEIVFNAPPQPAGTRRTIFLNSAGYYDIHLDRDQPPQTDFITYLGMNPGAIVKYSTEKYLEWLSEIHASQSEED